jgi:membrane-bound ClpP family serine protease
MDGRSITGLVIMLIGIVLFLFSIFIGNVGILSFGIWGFILTIIGLVIMLNKKEDKIEEINYSKLKGGLKKKK